MANEMLTRLTADMKAAMKAGEKERLSVLRMVINGIKEAQHQAEKDDLSEDEELAVLRRAVKTRRETVDQAEEAGRQEVADKERAEIAIIETYLPQMLQGDELLAKVREVAEAIGYSGPSDKGKFMKAWMADYKGMAEGRDVQAALGKLG